MKKELINEIDETKAEVIPTQLPEGKCCTTYCGDCSYFNASKTSYGKCWCGYYQSFCRVASDTACRNYQH